MNDKKELIDAEVLERPLEGSIEIIRTGDSAPVRYDFKHGWIFEDGLYGLATLKGSDFHADFIRLVSDCLDNQLRKGITMGIAWRFIAS